MPTPSATTAHAAGGATARRASNPASASGDTGRTVMSAPLDVPDRDGVRVAEPLERVVPGRDERAEGGGQADGERLDVGVVVPVGRVPIGHEVAPVPLLDVHGQRVGGGGGVDVHDVGGQAVDLGRAAGWLHHEHDVER